MNISKLKGVIFLLLAAFIWGVAYIPTRYLGEQGISAFAELGFRYSIPFLIFGIFNLKTVIKTPLHAILKLMGTGFILFISITFSIYGIRMVQFGSLGLLLLSLNVVLVPLYFVIFTKQKISPVLLFASVLSFTGTVILSIGEKGTPLNFGAILCLLASFGYTAYIILCSKILTFDIPATVLQFYQSLVFVIICFPLMFIFPELKPASIDFTNLKLIGSLLFIGIAAGTLGYQLYFHGQKISSPTVTALVLSSQIIFSTFADLIFFQITLNPLKIFAYICIIIAVFIVPFEDKFTSKITNKVIE